uniref:Uncharacterized protein n=1 Tax=Rhizochromulina marina TaxID=1034831 RepID=A0A7S2SP23_9STRA|mmetsp:Transcript_32911/g.95284  ORF Transcript_32911/g.95284 Transcript_32911/m.95284 type:complete len:275 (+) Transcript_32911:90-914(+)
MATEAYEKKLPSYSSERNYLLSILQQREVQLHDLSKNQPGKASSQSPAVAVAYLTWSPMEGYESPKKEKKGAALSFLRSRALAQVEKLVSHEAVTQAEYVRLEVEAKALPGQVGQARGQAKALLSEVKAKLGDKIRFATVCLADHQEASPALDRVATLAEALAPGSVAVISKDMQDLLGEAVFAEPDAVEGVEQWAIGDVDSLPSTVSRDDVEPESWCSCMNFVALVVVIFAFFFQMPKGPQIMARLLKAAVGGGVAGENATHSADENGEALRG